MSHYLRVFLVSFICFIMLLGGGLFAYISITNASAKEVAVMPALPDDVENGYEPPVVAVLSPLEKKVEESDRYNVLIIGTDGARADTIMFVSFDPTLKIADIVSVPRDTFNEVPGHDALGQKKINAVYGIKDEQNGGSVGMVKAVEKILGVPIESYIRLNYNGVSAITEVIGGVPVNVSKDMIYDDPYAVPELHINIPAGSHNLKGQQAVDYLRWRKNNGEEGEGDLPRTKRQQEFVKAAIKKCLTFKLPVVAKTAFEYIKTDLTLDEMAYYAVKAAGFNMADLQTHQLPGVTKMNGLSYYIHNADETEQMMLDIYSRGQDEVQTQ